MALKIELIRALVLLSSLAVSLLVLVLIGGMTIQSDATEVTVSNSEKMELNSESNPMIDAQIRGKALFKQNCASCHNRNMVDDMSGPALSGVTARWANYDQQDLYNWIRNSNAMVEAKHQRALAIWREWDKKSMTSFPNLKDQEISDILAFIER